MIGFEMAGDEVRHAVVSGEVSLSVEMVFHSPLYLVMSRDDV